MPYCRICKSELTKPLLELKNVPAAAQNMPSTGEELQKDRGIDLAICQCLNCGVLQHTSEPVPYYREVIRASGVSAEMKSFRLEQFKKWTADYKLAGKKIFEAGCGRGEYLRLMQSSGVEACGVEYGSSAVNICRASGLQVFQNFFQTGKEKLPGAPYDGFFILNFLEHIPDLPAFLQGIRNNLAPGAAGIVEVPNLDMILENSQLTEFSVEHLFYFTAESLSNLLHNQGFEVRRCRSIWYDYIISAEVVKRECQDLSGCAEIAGNITNQLDRFVSAHRKTVFWGAGHQALTTLAITGMDERKIAFVVDSSAEKQGRFTYTTHIPIVSPEHLADSDADAVVVACGGYSDEVVQILKKNFPERFAIAVLRENTIEIIKA